MGVGPNWEHLDLGPFGMQSSVSILMRTSNALSVGGCKIMLMYGGLPKGVGCG